MRYEPIKETLNRFISGSPVMRKMLYFLLDLLLLRAWHIRKALREISPELPENASILDAGSGLGQYSWRMSRKNMGWTVKGVDISRDQIEDCRRFFSKVGFSDRVNFSVLDLTKLDDRNAYNFILSVDVMEHIEEDVQVFKNFMFALKKDGVLLISTPSDQGGSDVHGADEKSFIDEHVRDGYGVEEIKAKLIEAGFSRIVTKYTYGNPGKISWRLSMKYPVKMLNISYLFFIILPFYYILSFPVSIILNIFDTHINHKTGTGLLVIARKE
jgi:2-polyprenyl-3-methyl-5-hydroxy-6-metoxy-1,4-benzoquinol methylase